MELRQWITTSQVGDINDFIVGKEIWFALHQLCKKIIEMNLGLMLSHKLYGDSRVRILMVEIELMPLSALTLQTTERVATAATTTTSSTPTPTTVTVLTATVTP